MYLKMNLPTKDACCEVWDLHILLRKHMAPILVTDGVYIDIEK